MAPLKRINYSNDAQALSAIKTNVMSIRKASVSFKIPKTTLIDKLKNKYKGSGNTGAPTVLTSDEENTLVKWIIEMGERGFPVTKLQLLESVTKLMAHLKRETPFKNGVPGDTWYKGFRTRHPEISHRIPQGLTMPRAAVTEKNIKDWFSKVTTYLEKNGHSEVIQDPSRIFNSDESGFYLSPKDKQVLVRKGSKKVYSRNVNDEKECLTILMTVSADGAIPPPMVIYPYKRRVPATILSKYPKKWGLGHTESGWMTSEAFYEYIANVFHPWIIEKKIKLPVIFFIDNHSSHINYHTVKLCKEIGIILTAFYTNSTHRLQPLDVGIFYPLKSAWRRNITQWRMKNTGQKLLREDFANILKVCIEEVVNADLVRKAFRTCGIFPFDENNIDYSKLVKNNNILPSEQTVNGENIDGVVQISSNISDGHRNVQLAEEIEKGLSPCILEQFKSTQGHWNGDVRYTAFYDFWHNLRKPQHTSQHRDGPENETDDTIVLVNEVSSMDVNIDEDTWINNNNCIDASIGQDGEINIILPIAENLKEKTPIKTSENINSNMFSSPFKHVLYWPEIKEKKKKMGKKMTGKPQKMTPVVAISDEYMVYQDKINTEKIQEEEKKMKRAERRDQKKAGKNLEFETNECETEEPRMHEEPEDAFPTYKTGDFIIVNYEGEYFPGTVISIENMKYKIQTMTMSGQYWKWPEKEDICEYLLSEIVCKIEVPIMVTNRGTYDVPKIKTLRNTVN